MKIESRHLKLQSAVQERLTNEIKYWDYRARDLRNQEKAGKPNAKVNSNEASRRADELQARLQKRMQELEDEIKISSKPPVVIGGALVIPGSWLSNSPTDTFFDQGFATPAEKAAIEKSGMDAVMMIEAQLNNATRDRSKEKIGYDIESTDSQSRNLRFIEVKGRKKDATTITITKNEIIYGLNLPEQFILALALVDGKKVEVHYVKHIFRFEPDFGEVAKVVAIKDLITKSVPQQTIELK